MSRLIWSPRALRDVQRIFRFLAVKDAAAAKRAVAAIRQGVKPLLDFPDMGRPAPNVGQGCRRWIVGFGSEGFTVLYRVKGDEIILLALRHQKEAPLA